MAHLKKLEQEVSGGNTFLCIPTASAEWNSGSEMLRSDTYIVMGSLIYPFRFSTQCIVGRWSCRGASLGSG
jgi:hypothetical protein